jgi:hypothetical protein
MRQPIVSGNRRDKNSYNRRERAVMLHALNYTMSESGLPIALYVCCDRKRRIKYTLQIYSANSLLLLIFR